MEKVSAALRRYFKNEGITQQQIADRLNSKQPFVSRAMSNQYKFTHTEAKKWAEKFGFSESFLVNGEGTLFGNSEQPLYLMGEVENDISSNVQPDTKEYWKQRCNELILQNTQLQGKIEGLQLAISALRLKMTE